jgi:hypothetical protein
MMLLISYQVQHRTCAFCWGVTVGENILLCFISYFIIVLSVRNFIIITTVLSNAHKFLDHFNIIIKSLIFRRRINTRYTISAVETAS